MLDADFDNLEGDATFEVEPDFGLDTTAVDTTLGDDVQLFYPKEMKHCGFDMSKLFSGYFLILILFTLVFRSCRTEGCPQFF